MSVTVPTEAELWNSDPNGFGKVDYTQHDTDLLPPEPEPEMIAPNLDPLVVMTPEPEPEPEPVQKMDEPAPEPEGPRVISFPDGGQAVIEKSSKGWKGIVDLGNGAAQNFYGKTKDELIDNLLKAQFNATKVIREQKKILKLGTAPETPVTVTQVEQATGKPLTADEKIELKLLLETDVDSALDTWFKKKTGRTVEQVVRQAERGEKADRELYMESVHKQFLANNPTYYADADFKNYADLVSYLAKHKLGRKLTPTNQQEILNLLLSGGHYTVQNLDEAFTDLSEDGLLLQAPRPVAPPAPTAPTASQERIVRTETRPRAGLGIRSTETTPVATPAPTPPSVEDFNKMTTAEIDAAIAAIYARENASRGRR